VFADRRLAGIQLFGGFREALGFINGDKDLQVTGFDGDTSF
jgi:hypothetical protein